MSPDNKMAGSSVRWVNIVTFIDVFTISYTMDYPFTYYPEMILWLGYREEDKGYCVGVMVAAYAVGSVLTVYLLSVVSDMYGHRTILTTLMVTNAIVNLLFAFSQDIYTVVVLRVIAGGCTAVISICRGNISTFGDDVNRAMMVSISLSASTFGVILGTSLGGFLASPAIKYTSVSGNSFLERFPYFLPPMAAVLSSIVGAVVTYIKLPDDISVLCEHGEKTNLSRDGKKKDYCSINFSGHVDDKDSTSHGITVDVGNPDIDKESTNANVGELTIENRRHECQHCHCASVSVTDQTIIRLPMEDGVGRKHRSVSVIGVMDHDIRSLSVEDNNREHNDMVQTTELSSCKGDCYLRELGVKIVVMITMIRESTFVELLKNQDVLRLSIAYAMTGITLCTYVELSAVWASTTRDLGGLAYTTDEIAMVMAIIMIPAALLQVLIVSVALSRLGCKVTCIVFSGLGVVAVSFTPMCRFIREDLTQWCVLIVCQFCAQIGDMGCCAATLILLSNCLTDAYAGALNGFGRTFNSFGKVFYPTIGGSIFAFSISSDIGTPIDGSLVFVLLGSGLLVISFIAYITPEYLNHKYETATGKTGK